MRFQRVTFFKLRLHSNSNTSEHAFGQPAWAPSRRVERDMPHWQLRPTGNPSESDESATPPSQSAVALLTAALVPSLQHIVLDVFETPRVGWWIRRTATSLELKTLAPQALEALVEKEGMRMICNDACEVPHVLLGRDTR